MKQQICEEVLTVLRKILRSIAVQSKQLEQAYGITIHQLIIMNAIDVSVSGSMTIGEISKKVGLSQATVTEIIDRLERKELVARERSTADRRRVNVSLTGQGKKTLTSAPSPMQKNFEVSFVKLEDWEQTLILSSLQRLAKMMDAADLPAASLLVEEHPYPEAKGKE